MRILIVTESIAGYGHEKAAKSIEKAIISIEQQNHVVANVKVVSLLFVFNRFVERMIRWIYMQMIKHLPWLWHWMYNRESKFAFIFKNIIAKLLLLKVESFIQREKPDLIIATHAAGIRALIMLKDRYHFRLASVFTDYQLNQFWIDHKMDYYFVPHESFKNTLIDHYQISPNKVFVSGIPIDPTFANCSGSYPEKEMVKNKSFRILVMGGGLGLGGIKEVILALQTLREVPIELVVITGTNDKLFNELAKMTKKFPYPTKLYPFVEDMYSLMRGSDLLISKAGGLTISEAMSLQLPILIYKALPGQEEKNVTFVTKENAAIQIKKSEEITYWVSRLYHNGDLFHSLQQRAKNLAHPNSSIFIAETLLKEVGGDGSLLQIDFN